MLPSPAIGLLCTKRTSGVSAQLGTLLPTIPRHSSAGWMPFTKLRVAWSMRAGAESVSRNS